MTDEKVEILISYLLRTGVMLAAAVVLAGGAWYLAAHGTEIPAYRTFHATHWKWSDWGRARGLIEVGLLILIATPVARVIFSLVSFALERDSTYVLITLGVLLVLVYSLAPF